MTRFAPLVLNEVTKMIRKRRFQVVLGILAVLLALFAYAENQTALKMQRQLGTADWRVQLQHQIVNQQNRLKSPLLSSAQKSLIQARLTEYKYYLDHDINPSAPGAPTFMRTFIDEGISLLIPLFVVVIASDIVSSEMSGGTIKLLLTRPVSRARILASKLVALVLLLALLMAIIAILSYLISGIFFGYRGFDLPVLIGFQTAENGTVDVSHVHMVAQWQYLFMSYGLAFFVCLCVGALSFMVSVLVRSTASSMGIMIAALIAGTLLTGLAGNWTPAKYLPVVHLKLSGYLMGNPPPFEGVTFPFSLSVLTVWAFLAVIVSFVVFSRKDMMG
jgi:ABC-2 type transport system permease protein